MAGSFIFVIYYLISCRKENLSFLFIILNNNQLFLRHHSFGIIPIMLNRFTDTYHVVDLQDDALWGMEKGRILIKEIETYFRH